MPDLVPYDRTPLWVVFWLYGVVPSALLAAAVTAAFGRVGTPVFAAMLMACLAYTIWIVRKVWVHAFNVRNALYGHIARALTVVWAINAILVELFVLLEHAEARGLLGA